MPQPTLRPPPRHWAAALVLGLHLLGLGLGLRSAAWPDRRRPEVGPPPLTVHLLRPLALADMRPRATAAPRLPAAVAWRPKLPAMAAPALEAQAITVPAPAAGASAASPVRRLNLTLPLAASAPWRVRHPGLDDPRANTPRATMESRINAAMGGDDRLIEERLDENAVRFRKGRGCVIVQSSRAALIDPGNQSFSRMPGLAKPC